MTRRVWWSWTLGVCLVALAGCSSAQPAPKAEYVPTSLEAEPCPTPRPECVGTGHPIEDLFAQLREPC